jgi:hypothetical protein
MDEGGSEEEASNGFSVAVARPETKTYVLYKTRYRNHTNQRLGDELRIAKSLFPI